MSAVFPIRPDVSRIHRLTIQSFTQSNMGTKAKPDWRTYAKGEPFPADTVDEAVQQEQAKCLKGEQLLLRVDDGRTVKLHLYQIREDTRHYGYETLPNGEQRKRRRLYADLLTVINQEALS